MLGTEAERAREGERRAIERLAEERGQESEREVRRAEVEVKLRECVQRLQEEVQEERSRHALNPTTIE